MTQPEHEDTGDSAVPSDATSVSRFSLRRGARFLETFREGPGSGDADEAWLAGLRQELVGDADHDAGAKGGDLAGAGLSSPETHAPPEAPRSPAVDGAGGQDYKTMLEELVAGALRQGVRHSHPQPHREAQREPVGGLAGALAALSERLAVLEDALANAAAACKVTRSVLARGMPVLDQPPSPSPREEPGGAAPAHRREEPDPQ